MITRRNLLKGIGGSLIAAPFVAESGLLMPVKKLAVPSLSILYGDGITDDAGAIQDIMDGKPVMDYKSGFIIKNKVVPSGYYLTRSTIQITEGSVMMYSCINSDHPGYAFSGSGRAVFHGNKIIANKFYEIHS